MPESARQIAAAFVEAINRRSGEEIANLITEDHAFIDALGARIEGKKNTRAAWKAYFGIVPDYTIQVEEIFSEGAAVVLLGVASGTYAPEGVLRPRNRWSAPAAWRAVVEGSSIAEWRVYTDNAPLRRIIAQERNY